MNEVFRRPFEKDGKDYKKSLHNPKDLLEKDFEVEIVFRLSNIYLGKNKKR